MQSGLGARLGRRRPSLHLFFSLLPPETAWRALFFVGIAPAILVFFLRRYIEEPEVYRESQAKIAETGDKPSFFEIFQPPLLRITFLGALMSTGAQGGYFAGDEPGCRLPAHRAGPVGHEFRRLPSRC